MSGDRTHIFSMHAQKVLAAMKALEAQGKLSAKASLEGLYESVGPDILSMGLVEISRDNPGLVEKALGAPYSLDQILVSPSVPSRYFIPLHQHVGFPHFLGSENGHSGRGNDEDYYPRLLAYARQNKFDAVISCRGWDDIVRHMRAIAEFNLVSQQGNCPMPLIIVPDSLCTRGIENLFVSQGERIAHYMKYAETPWLRIEPMRRVSHAPKKSGSARNDGLPAEQFMELEV